ncbi:type III effector [Endozoicomonas sp. OPT23]|uniref:HopJ type III effector protein n=1 Tax=Endozoicomonas sp. OPT23 TaxID=2072845 RepID=UPI00129B8DA8|nr:HopJ type III effector protein [Endozoicomonas sp. OPT23]MRI33454.1 type III effector [Endozoicomonas sp. OPT23]
MSLNELLSQLKESPETVEFQNVMSVINENYEYTACGFKNGDQQNTAGTNEGSCKILAFGQLNKLSEAHTLHCFGLYYRDEVLNDSEGSSHGNIRAFMKTGWSGVEFEQFPLKETE